MQLKKYISRATLTKPHICKIQGIWVAFPPLYKSDVPGSGDWFIKAEQYTQRMNCREMMKHKNLEMFRND